MIWTSLLNPAIDVIYRVPSLSDKTTFTSLNTFTYPAGKAVNFAKTVRALGEPVSMAALMPVNDTARFQNYLEQYEIETHFFPIEGDVRINATVLDESSGLVQHFNSMGQQCSPQIQERVISFLQDKMSSGDFWAFSGSVPDGIDQEIYGKLIQYCNENNIRAALDSRGLAFEFGVAAHPLLVVPNEAELEELFEESVRGIQHIALRGKRLIDRGIPYVFITLGADGVIALHGNECLLCKSPVVENGVKNTVGCGDAFLAGVVVGMERGFSFHEICRMAVACGFANTLSIGSGEISADQVWYFMEKINVTSI